MKATRNLLAVIILALTATIMLGCGQVKDDSVVATVNDLPITVGYMQAKWAKMAENDAALFPDSLSLEEIQDKVLDTLIKKELIVSKAHEEGYISDEVYVNAYNSHLDYRLIELLKNQEIVDKLPEFSEEEIQDHYQYIGKIASARHIEVDGEQEAADIRAKIEAGEMSFHDAILEYSTNQDRFSGGKMQQVSFGVSVVSVENALFHMEEGQMSQPVKVPNGWALLYLDEMTVQEAPPFEQVRDQIVKRLEVRALRSIGDAHGSDVLKKYGFKFHWDVAAEIIDLMPDDLVPSQLNDPPVFEKPILKFSDEQKQMVLYEIEGEKHTLAEFSDEYDELSIYERPNKGSRSKGIYNKVRRQMINYVMPLEARSRGMENDPDLVVAMKEYEEQNCIGSVKRMLVDAPMEFGDEQVQAFYEEHPLLYTRKYAVICKQLVTNTEDDIREAYRRLEAGAEFDSVGADFAITWPQSWTTEWFTPDSLTSPDHEVFRQVLRLENVNDYTPPFEYQGYWAVYQMVQESDPVLLPLEDVYQRARSEAFESASSARLESLLIQWRDEAEVVIHEKVLRKVQKGEAPNPNRDKYKSL
ncbi:peptidyl-prolyl cis-trans isomerase [bacterium]|nr:peptidyl-prolyl cis-trans isomerase [bacterium]